MSTKHGSERPSDPPPTEAAALAAEIRALRAEVRRFNDHSFVRVQNSVWKLLGYQLLKGLALGLGTALGASILLSVFAYFLSQVELLPIIGDWATRILEEIEMGRGPAP